MIQNYIVYFFSYAFLGWIMEVIYALFVDKKLVNRGFVIGPLCPIYGVGCCLMFFLLGSSKDDLIGLYLKSIVIAAVLEYFTSFCMEKLFNARWWDYSDRKFNINGRICLETMIPFGLLAIFSFKIIKPFLDSKILLFASHNLNVILACACIIFIVDVIISFIITYQIKDLINKVVADNTIEIRNKMKTSFKGVRNLNPIALTKKVKSILLENWLTRRVINAFPSIRFDFNEIKNQIEKQADKINVKIKGKKKDK